MNCADFLVRLQGLLDQRRDPQADATLRRHAASCADCRERLESQDRLFLGLALAFRAAGEDTSDLPRPTFADVTLAEADYSSGNAARSLAKFAGLSVAVAALLLAGAWTLWGPHRESNGVNSGSVALATSTRSIRTAGDRDKSSPRSDGASIQVVKDATSGPSHRTSPGPLAAVPHGPTESASPAALLATGSNWPFASGRFARQLDTLRLNNLGLDDSLERFSDFYETVSKTPPIPESSVPQVEQLAEEVRPLAQPFVSVINVLRRSLPGPKNVEQPSGDHSSRNWPPLHLI